MCWSGDVAAKKIDATAINVMSGKSYEQEFEFEGERRKVGCWGVWHRDDLKLHCNFQFCLILCGNGLYMPSTSADDTAVSHALHKHKPSVIFTNCPPFRVVAYKALISSRVPEAEAGALPLFTVQSVPHP